jgi:hypothetical protein
LVNTDAATDWTLRHLAYTNQKVDEINLNVLCHLPGQLITFNALDKVKGPAHDQSKIDAAIRHLKNMIREPSSNLETKLHLKVGCKVMYLTNKLHLGLFNGAQGKVSGFGKNVIFVDFERNTIGDGARTEWGKPHKIHK